MSAPDDNPLFQSIWDTQTEATNSLINGYAKRDPRDVLADCDRMLQCIAGFDTVFVMSSAQAVEVSHNLDDEWLAGFNRTFEMLCLAGTERGIDLEPFKELATSAYSFWTGSLPVREMGNILKRLFDPCVSALYNLKRALIVECGKTEDTICHGRLVKSLIWRTGLALGILVVVEVVIGYFVWRYGEGPNLFQKLTNAWCWLALGLAVVAVLYPFIMGRERMRLLKWWKGETDEPESKPG